MPIWNRPPNMQYTENVMRFPALFYQLKISFVDVSGELQSNFYPQQACPTEGPPRARGSHLCCHKGRTQLTEVI